MTAEKLAERLKTSKSVISKLETGEQRWNQDWLEQIAFVFGCEVEELFMDPKHIRAHRVGRRFAHELAEDSPAPDDHQ